MVGLRRRCEVRLRGIRIPSPFDLDTFCAEVASTPVGELQHCGAVARTFNEDDG